MDRDYRGRLLIFHGGLGAREIRERNALFFGAANQVIEAVVGDWTSAVLVENRRSYGIVPGNLPQPHETLESHFRRGARAWLGLEISIFALEAEQRRR